MRRFTRRVAGYAEFPSGTVMLFYQALSPVGWQIVTTPDDCVVTIDDENGGTTGGTGDITAGITTSSESSHTHGVGSYQTTGITGTTNAGGGALGVATDGHQHSVTGTSGAGSAHNHTVSAKYAKCILSKRV